jgi:hypothetical protein
MRLKVKIMTMAVLLCLVACRTYYVFPPVEVATEDVSPTYRFTILNGLAEQLVVEHVSQNPDDQIILASGHSTDFILVVKKLKVGGSPVAQVVEGGYIHADGTGFGAIGLHLDEPGCPGCTSCKLRLDIRHSNWFVEQRRNENTPPIAKVCITECLEGRVVFRAGPEAGCSL